MDVLSHARYYDQLLHPPPGLIIDAFGELRDQQEQVKEDMEVSLKHLISFSHMLVHKCGGKY